LTKAERWVAAQWKRASALRWGLTGDSMREGNARDNADSLRE
jgi:hypothetical protein